ncbi:MAG: guanylate kinase [Lentimicrobiaceae bacterium]|nr:guanylate kinase [Lentimicrobiaceae bacterium]
MDSKNLDKLVIVSAPSGSGKTTIVNHLLKTFEQLGFSLSYTNREIRKGEVDGVNYRFISTQEFKKLIADDMFLEWEEVYKNTFYGTPLSEISRLQEAGKVPILDIDVVGGSNVKKMFGDKALAVFIKTPSIEVLEQRLRNRKTETEESIIKRVNKVSLELEYEKYFDVTIINDVLGDALSEAERIIKQFLNE